MQQADGWQEPEVLIYSGQVASELASELESEQGPQSGTRTEFGPESAPSYLPWLETVAPRKLREEPHAQVPIEQDQGQGHSGTGPNRHFRQFDPAESLAALLHDTRNMVSAIDLYCDLLEEPSVLAPAFRHYAGELRLVGGASRRLLEKLSVLHLSTDFATGLATDRKSDLSCESRTQNSQDSEEMPPTKLTVTPVSHPVLGRVAHPAQVPHVTSLSRPGRAQFFQPGEPIQSLADELMANRNILSALAGPGIEVGLSISGGHRPIAMTGDDLTRILVNLCRNAADVMPGGGQIRVTLMEGAESLLLTFADNGPGIPEASLEAIFAPGFTGHVGHDRDSHSGTGSGSGARSNGLNGSKGSNGSNAWPAQHRGLGLAIVRSIVSASGGSVWAANRANWTGSQVQATVADISGAGIKGAVIALEFPLIERRRIT